MKCKRKKTVIMDSKNLKNAFGLSSIPDSPLKIGQRKPAVIFTIIPEGIVGIGYKFMVSCSIPIRWSRIHSVFQPPKRQKLSITQQGKYPY